MFTYKYNLRELGYQEDQYDSIGRKAQRLARGASAVDTGRFKNGWTTKVQGDILLVQNAVRYAPFVELGSIVYRFHRYRIRRALASIGLKRGTESFGTGTTTGFSDEGNAPPAPTGQGQTPSTQTPKAVPQIQPITEQEIRSPALVVRRLKIPRTQPIAVPQVQQIPKAQLFNRSRLLELLVAAEIANQTQNNNEE
jgi:hypothetical protein